MSTYTHDSLVIAAREIITPLGNMKARASKKGITSLSFSEIDSVEVSALDVDNPYLDQIEIELNEYFAGTRYSFAVPLDIQGSDFQMSAWQVLCQIPYGKTISYSQQAQLYGNPKASRAVGTANGCNKIAIIIPCHRVVAKDGSLGGYAGGIDKKKWLLDHEQLFVES